MTDSAYIHSLVETSHKAQYDESDENPDFYGDASSETKPVEKKALPVAKVPAPVQVPATNVTNSHV